LIFTIECQSGLLRDYKKIKGYGTQQNDIWSLGVILINLVTGRNPWRQATMEDSTFAAYTHQPHQFFSAILPTISTELDELLQRIFCLDPAHRISLPELKWRILECKSFLCNQPDMLISARQKKKLAAAGAAPPSPLEQPTLSITQSIWEYTNDFTRPSAVVSSPSSSSSVDSIGPATPPLVAPGATCTKISHDALVDLIQASSMV
jgi:serine/threonine protein kinase